jgi:hypothetical protein
MPLLNPPDILPEAMRFLVRALLALPAPPTREELVDLVAPPGLAEAMASAEPSDEPNAGDEADVRSTGRLIADRSLTALRTISLVHEDKGAVVLADRVRQRCRQPRDLESGTFAGLLLERVVGDGAGEGDPDARGVGDLFHGLELLHAAGDPLRPFDSFDEGAGRRRFIEWQQERLGLDRSGWPVANRERWLPLRRWAVYLGAGRLVSGRLMADGSTALERSLRALPSRDYPIDDFVQRCVATLPFLDANGSPFGHDVEGERAVLSPGMSLTFAALRAKGLLTLYSKSDTGGRTMRVRADRSLDERVTHVSWSVRGPRTGAVHG